ncbi:LLM class flavin-dependent oxidoreductase [Microlunatus ginsengisoli]|uniref:LLM class flavin-dependent oxidoreductase n=1 Tax=Microlunatus ginsengisoli TaxID=363863 RepID=A0ABP6ZUR2_9ACTN
MTTAPTPRLGITYVPYRPPEELRELALAADDSGLDELWVWEDCFKQSGVAAAGAALAWTRRIRIGIGLMPTPLRNVGLAAMEIATLERLFPGRLIPGIGHGVQDWMGQAGVRASSPLTLLREYATALRRLLAGEEVTTEGRYVRLDRVRLDWPPEAHVPLAIGADGPKSVAVAGELGDVFLLSAARSAEQITAARTVLDQAAPGRRHEIVGALIASTGPGARERVDAELARWTPDGEPGFSAAGDAESVAAQLRRVAELGVTSVAIQPTADEPDLLGLARFLGTEVRPLLGG